MFCLGDTDQFWYGVYTSSVMELMLGSILQMFFLSARTCFGSRHFAVWLHGTLEIWAIIRSRCCRTCFGQRLAVSRHLFETRIFPQRSEKRAEDCNRYGARVYHGGIYRRLYHPSHRTSGYAEARHHPYIPCIYHLLLYLFTK